MLFKIKHPVLRFLVGAFVLALLVIAIPVVVGLMGTGTWIEPMQAGLVGIWFGGFLVTLSVGAICAIFCLCSYGLGVVLFD